MLILLSKSANIGDKWRMPQLLSDAIQMKIDALKVGPGNTVSVTLELRAWVDAARALEKCVAEHRKAAADEAYDNVLAIARSNLKTAQHEERRVFLRMVEIAKDGEAPPPQVYAERGF